MPDWVQKEAERTEQILPIDAAPEAADEEENLPEWLADAPRAQEIPAAQEVPAEQELPAVQEEAVFEETVNTPESPAYPSMEIEAEVTESTAAQEETFRAEQETPVDAQLNVEAETANLLSETEYPVDQDFKADETRQAEEVPDWLQGLEDESVTVPVNDEPIQWGAEYESTPTADETLPDWLKTEKAEAQAAPAAGENEEFPEWLMGLEEEATLTSEVSEDQAPALPGEYSSAWEPEIAGTLDYEPAQPEAAPQPKATNGAGSPLLELQAALNRGDLDLAMDGYSSFIQNEEHLEEVIHDLRDALYRYPVDISIWQTLGDAYARNNQLQEALDAYTKAEELLR